MGTTVYEAGRDDLTTAIEPLHGFAIGQISDQGDTVVHDADVRNELRISGTIDNSSAS